MNIRGSNGLPDISATTMREDFLLLYNMHKKIDCILIKYSNSEGGDFFNDDSEGSTEDTITLSIQGTADSIDRLKQGIEAPKGSYHCYAIYNQELHTTDKIKINGLYFKINNLQSGLKNNDTIFQEFDLVYIERV